MLRTRPFWMLQLYNVLGCLPWQGLNFHMTAVVEENGFGGADLALIYAPLAVSSCAGSFAGGVLLDALHGRRASPLLALLLPLGAISGTLALHLVIRGSRPGLVAFGALLGLFQGSNITTFTTMPATLFGRRHLGAITASTYISGQLTSAAGSAVFGVAKDAAGSFRPLFGGLLAGLLVMAAALLADETSRRRGRPARQPEDGRPGVEP